MGSVSQVPDELRVRQSIAFLPCGKKLPQSESNVNATPRDTQCDTPCALARATIITTPAEATHKQYRITFGPDHRGSILLDLMIPKGRGPFPVILRGDWGWHKTANDIAANVIKRGYILADYNRVEMAPDNKNRDAGIYPLYPDQDFGAIAAWAWGFHRCVDVLVTLDFVDK